MECITEMVTYADICEKYMGTVVNLLNTSLNLGGWGGEVSMDCVVYLRGGECHSLKWGKLGRGST